MSVVPSGMRNKFEAGGWFPGRTIEVALAVPFHHPAHAVLAEIGELTLLNPAPAIRGATAPAAGDTQRTVAAFLGVSQATISRLSRK
jgi:hypothetical protein